MALIVGNEYYWLTPEDYNWLVENYKGSDGLLDDFELAPDGFYYADPGAISDDEYDFLLEYELANMTYYSKSTQPGGGL